VITLEFPVSAMFVYWGSVHFWFCLTLLPDNHQSCLVTEGNGISGHLSFLSVHPIHMLAILILNMAIVTLTGYTLPLLASRAMILLSHFDWYTLPLLASHF
jgi:hypothetical protein